MADQFNDSIPAVTNQITEDVADIAETLGFIKDVFQNFCYNWSNTVATQVFPNKMDDDDEVLINIAGSEVISVTATGYDVLGVPQGLDVTEALHTKILDLGDWNMDATDSISVAHSITAGKIREVLVTIRLDAADTVVPLNYAGQDADDGAQGSWYASATEIVCYRKAGGHFDSTSYNATSYNRGWAIIRYVD